jgi:N6-L-threonylcarbamoyladenine synthase
MRILAIETSCDETSAAVVEDGLHVRSNVIASSRDAFERSGGVIPEQAAREQLLCIGPVVAQALEKATCTWNDIEAIGVTRGPGLLGSLLVGTTAARAWASIGNIPLIGVHHTLGHLSSTWLDSEKDEPQFPVLTLSASGGHTELWYRESHLTGTLLGRTRDDAAGEAFDKGAALLGLPYPGGPAIGKIATEGKPDAFDFPLPLKKEDTLDFSFSGLKTALRYTIRDACHGEPDESMTRNLAASFQAAICAHLLDRIQVALKRFPEIKELHIVGGVSANTYLRDLAQKSLPAGVRVRFPLKMSYCTDNAAMIGSAAQWMANELRDAAYEKFETTASLPLAQAVTMHV